MGSELLKREANASGKSRKRHMRTPLHLAMAKHRPCLDLVSKLLKRRSDLEAKDDFSCTPLWEALYWNVDYEIIDLLFKNGVNVFIVNTHQTSALHLTARNNNTYVMRRLIEEGHPVDARNKLGCTPLHDAVYNGSKDAAEVLIENGESSACISALSCILIININTHNVYKNSKDVAGRKQRDWCHCKQLLAMAPVTLFPSVALRA